MTRLSIRLVGGDRPEHAQAPNALDLLCGRCQRPRRSHSTDNTDKIPPPHACRLGSGRSIVAA